MDSLALHGTNTLDIGCWIYTREQDEEGWSSDSHFAVNDLHVERWLLDVLDTKRVSYVLCKGTIKTIRSEGTKE